MKANNNMKRDLINFIDKYYNDFYYSVIKFIEKRFDCKYCIHRVKQSKKVYTIPVVFRESKEEFIKKVIIHYDFIDRLNNKKEAPIVLNGNPVKRSQTTLRDLC